MENLYSLFVLSGAIIALLILIVRLKLPAFFAILLVSAGVGLSLGLPPQTILNTIRDGMGGTLGFIAIVVGLGAMLGALLETAGGIQAISNAFMTKLSTSKAPWALSFVGFLIAIPVFFDVGFIILIPMITGLARKTGKSLLFYALPLAAGLAAAHAFIPPTPGPIAVAELLKADLGWVIFLGIFTALPAAFVGGPILATLAFKNTDIGHAPPINKTENTEIISVLSLGTTLIAIALPLVLIIMATLTNTFTPQANINTAMLFIGHPFCALMITLSFLYTKLRLSNQIDSDQLNTAMAKALEPAAAIILVTGAGGAFKQVLIETGAGTEIASMMIGLSFTPLVFGFISAAIIRIMQGSATVAMITGAGLTAPLVDVASLNAPQTALVVIAVAAGATAFSHVNDSGFWLINRYLGLSVTDTFKSWTVCATLIGLTGFACALLLSLFF